jgi:hypothetical protein
MKKPRRMLLTRWGLALHYYKILVVTFSLAVMLILLSVAVVTASLAMFMPVGWVGAMLIAAPVFYAPLLLLFWAIAVLIGVAGSILCLWVPQRTGAKPLIIAALVVEALGLFLFAFGGLSGFALIGSDQAIPSVGELRPFFGSFMALSFLGGMVLMFCAWVLCMLFSRALLIFYFTDSLTAKFAVGRVTRGVVLIVCTPIYVFITPFIVDAAASISAFYGLSTLMVLIIIFSLLWIRLLVNILRILDVLRGRMRHLENAERSLEGLPRLPLRSIER